ncbi:MAG: hypothetical protein KR126chlam1_01528 [Chlamydiae bacterium]|nr:hypothetical protein [Chlamydiota bacterium]
MSTPLIASSAERENTWRHTFYRGAHIAIEPIRIYSWTFLRAIAPWKVNREDLLEKFKEKLNSDAPELSLLNGISSAQIDNPFFRSKVVEVAFRLLLGTAVVVTPLIGTQILEVPVLTQIIQGLFLIGVLGQITHSVTSLSDRKGFCLRHGSNFRREKKENASSIATWNIGQLPVFAPLHVGCWQSLISQHFLHKLFRKIGLKSCKQDTRLERQVNVLRDLKADILCLQESSIMQVDILRKKLDYPFVYTAIGEHPWKRSSGLTILSKVFLENFSFESFKTTAGINRLANRGFAHFTTTIGNVNTRVYVTHLNPSSALCRIAQLEEIESHIKKTLEEEHCHRALLVGDLNLDRINDEADWEWYESHFETSPVRTVTCTNLLKFMNSLGNKKVELESIDAIGFYLGGKSPEEGLANSIDSTASSRQRVVSMVQVTPDSLLSSDHSPLVADLLA